jgi:TusA-related sulfurtransferase
MKQMLIESKFDMHKLKKGDLLVVKVPDAGSKENEN